MHLTMRLNYVAKLDITLLILRTEGTRILDTSLLSFAAIECLVSGVLGIKLIKEQRKASSKFKLNSLMMIHIPLEEYHLKIIKNAN